MRYLKLLFVFAICLSKPAFSQYKVGSFVKTFSDTTFSKISADAEGAWIISGDSTKIYRFNNGEVTECKAFSNITSLKYTSLISKGASSVLVGTNTDSLFFLSNGNVLKLSITAGTKPLMPVKLYGDVDYTCIVYDNQVYTLDYNNNFYYQYKLPVYSNSYLLYGNSKFSIGYISDNKIYTKYNIDSETSLSLDQIANDEVPLQVIPKQPYFFHYGYLDTSLIFRTNKRIYDFGSRKSLYNNPSAAICEIGYNLYMCTELGILQYDVEKGAFRDTIFKNESFQNVSVYDNSLYAVSQNKIFGLTQYTKPDITAGQQLEICRTYFSNIDLENLKIGDVINWYRNDTLIPAQNDWRLLFNTPGNYKAIISNTKFNTVDTTHVVKADWYKGLPYITISAPDKVCEGNDNLYIESNSSNIELYKDGVVIQTNIESSVNIPITESGTYWIIAENCNGYKVESPKKTVEFVKKPTFLVNYENGTTLCTGSTLQFESNADFFYYYNFGRVDEKSYYVTTDVVNNTLSLTVVYGWNNKASCVYSQSFEYKVVSLPYATIQQDNANLTAIPAIFNSNGVVVKSFDVQQYQWYYNNNEIVGANTSVVPFTKGGEYKVKLVDKNGCVNYSKVNLFSTDIKTISISDLNIAPNPTVGPVYLTGEMVNKITKIEVYNSLSKLELVKNKDFNEVDLSALVNGLYYLKVYANNSVFTYKISVVK
jgi:hypothetical protein